MATAIIDFNAISSHGIDLFGNGGATATLTGSMFVNYSAAGGAGSATFVNPIKVEDNTTNNTFSFITPISMTTVGNNYYDSMVAVSNGYYGILTISYTGQHPTFLTTATFMEMQSCDCCNGTAGALFGATNPPVCFATGTRIRTSHGDVAVEALSVGDLVLTTSGELRPVKWLGHREFVSEPGLEASRHEVIRIAAHAFGANRPSQDLVVSPGHAICVDLVGEVLIPAMWLVNGATVARELRDEVALWHVELDTHDVLVANNLPAESYLAMGNRGFFEEAGATLASFEDGKDASHDDFCRPVAIDGPIVAFVRERLIERATALGWRRGSAVNLRLVVDGRIHVPVTASGAAAFLFPAEARDVRLVSDTFEPAMLGSPDGRRLGALVLGLMFSGTSGQPRRVDLGDERLRDGVYGLEQNGAECWRWTDGECFLDPELWEGLSGAVSLLVDYVDHGVRGWIAPPVRATPAVQERDERPMLRAVA